MYGKCVDKNHILMDGISLGNATIVTSSEIYIGKNPGLFRLEARAKTALTILTTGLLNIEVFHGPAGACVVPIAGTHQYLAHKTSADDEKVYAAGALIGSMVFPKEFGPNFLVKTTVDEDHTTETVDIFLVPVG